MEDYKKKYEEVLNRAKGAHNSAKSDKENGVTDKITEYTIQLTETIFPELKESEDERIRKTLINFFSKGAEYDSSTNGIKDRNIISWLEKQGEKFQYWKPSEEQLEALDYAYNSCPDTERGNYYEGVLETLIDDLHKLSEKQSEQKSADKVEPKFRVKYAGNKYNVLEIKDIAGVTFYGIEDEPNHIDYVLPENCEIVSGYSVKEKGSPYPTKLAMFSERHPAWSEEDEQMFTLCALSVKTRYNDGLLTCNEYEQASLWLKSLKDIYTWKPSDKQINTLEQWLKNNRYNGDARYCYPIFDSLYQDLKKLKEK